jgi:tRNA(Ile)-lysidine synthase TilS/MesJ
VIEGQAPRARQFCSRCVLPDTFPGIRFDERGVCQHCRKSEAGERRREQEKARYRQKFLDLLRELNPPAQPDGRPGGAQPGGARPYDVLMAFSGGKDSSFTLLKLQRDYGLRILALTFDNGFLSPAAVRNAQAVTRALGIDHLAVSPSRKILARAFRRTLDLDVYPLRALERASSICNTCMNLVKAYLLKTAVEMGIPIMAYGWSPGQAPLQSSVIRWNPAMIHQMQAAVVIALNAVGGDDLMPYCPGERHWRMLEDTRGGPRGEGLYNVHPLAFLEYDEEKIIREIRDLGWEDPKDTDPNSTNCLLNALGIKVHLERYGFHPYALEIACLVREGHMSREAGLGKLSLPLDEGVIRRVEESLRGEEERNGGDSWGILRR